MTDKPEKSLLLGVVSYDPALDAAVVDALNSSLYPLASSGWQFAYVLRSSEADLGHSRNGFATEMVVGPFSDLQTIDGDVAWERGAIQKLQSHPVDFVVGAYPRRDDSGAFSLQPKPGPLIRVNPLTGEPDDKGLIDVLSAPLGFARISRRCIERMIEAYPDRWYWDLTVTGGKAWSFFEFSVRDHQREREDYCFCRLWREIGGKVWVDPDLRLTHVGRKAWTGRLADKLKADKPGVVDEEFLKTLA